jgi:hypothetical protein
MSYPILAQRDARWKDKSIGYSSVTVGPSGCLFISLLMMVCKDQAFAPAYIDSFMGCLKGHGNYTQAGEAYLQSFDVSVCRPATWGPCVVQNPRAVPYVGIAFPQSELKALITWLNSGQCAIVEVDDRGPNAGDAAEHKKHQHFVLAIGVDANGVIKIHDPWYGDETTLTPRYGPTNEYAIYRAILYQINPVQTHPTVAFTATPTTVAAGETVTLSWKAEGIAGIWLDGAPEAGVMTRTRTPVQTTIYTLTVLYNDGLKETFTRTVTVTSPIVATKPVLGINNIFTGADGQAAIDAGVESISVTFNPQWAGEIKQRYPKLKVAVRGLANVDGYLPSIDQWWNTVWQGAVDGNTMIGLNENNHGLGTSPEDIRKRIAWDKQALARVKAEAASRGITLYYAGGGFSVGEPNIVIDAVVEAMAGYAELLKDPLFKFNQHLYASGDGRQGLSAEMIRDLVFDDSYGDFTSKRFVNGKWESFTERIYQRDWTLTRWHFYYRRCGWVGGKIVCDETGLDIGSVGGFASMTGCDDAFMQRWARKMIAIQYEPLSINGILYPSPVEWLNIFQTGNRERWLGYEMNGRLAAMSACKWGQA